MDQFPDLTAKVESYYHEKIATFGASPRGVDWSSTEGQEIRFAQLIKIFAPHLDRFSILDFGCGYGALLSYLIERGYAVDYVGYDLSPAMVESAKNRKFELGGSTAAFFSRSEALTPADFAIASGIFNIKLDATISDWEAYVHSLLHLLDRLSVRGFSFNMLTSYSDSDKMKNHLYYADPCKIFDYCKRNFSKDVALLHDYSLYDFTILVKKVR